MTTYCPLTVHLVLCGHDCPGCDNTTPHDVDEATLLEDDGELFVTPQAPRIPDIDPTHDKAESTWIRGVDDVI